MIVVGVTGKYCSGKSTVAELLVEHGYEQIDVDSLGHEALEIKQEAVIETFGEEIRGTDGGIDRKALGRVVFSDDKKLQQLEAILHPTMVRMAAERVDELRETARSAGSMASAQPPGVVINAAILFRMGLHTLCDRVLYVTAPFFSIRRRARERDGASLFEVIRRLRLQRDVDPQFSHPDADIYSVVNDGDREKLRGQLARLLPLP